MAQLRGLLFLLGMFLATLSAPFASTVNAETIPANFKGDNIALIGLLKAVESNDPRVVIEVTADSAGNKLRFSLASRRSAPPYRWAVFTLSNPDLVKRDFVLQIPRQGFVNSGLIWPASLADKVVAVSASQGGPIQTLPTRNANAYALSVGPGLTNTFALELTPKVLRQVNLWHRAAFEEHAGELAFFTGVVLGISIFLGVGILALFVVRPMFDFVAAGFFAWAIVAFLLFDTHILPQAMVSYNAAGLVSYTRAGIESALLIGFALCVLSFLQLTKNAPVSGGLMSVFAVAGAGIFAFGLYDPVVATGLARMTFFALSVYALIIGAILWYGGIKRARTSLLVWITLFVWSLAAASAVAVGVGDPASFTPAIQAGLVLVLITMGFTLAPLVFNRSVAASHFLEDSGRRALALAGSEQSVWDWHPNNAQLYIGPELERALGLRQGMLGGISPGDWHELIHPVDRNSYVSAINAAEKRGTGAFSSEFRLRRSDGTYRWYLLKARAIAGDDAGASRLIGTLNDVTMVKRSEERLLADAVRDRVTGLPNRALFIDRLERAMRRARAVASKNLYVLVIDLDRFKNVNDGLGHEVADSLLNVTAQRLARMIGPDDTLARLSGDQFGIIFNGGTPEGEIFEISDNVRQMVSVPINVRPREIFLTACIGVAQYDGASDNPEVLLKNTEIALYEAKRQGNDHIEFYQSDMHDDRSQLLALEHDLRRAIDRNEIEVVYQPIRRLYDDQLAGFEALVRWRHPVRGLLTPDAFIGMAEDTGIIREVGRYVLNEAARQLGIWQRAFRPSDPLFVAVNVSSAQLLNYELIADLKTLLGREDIVPGSLKIELTETLVMENPSLAAKVLERASELGVGISCDDFGTGYSALANLGRLPFDTLKIDKVFLDGDGKDKNASVLLDAITALAHELGMNVVAEGVESEEQLLLLKHRGCDYAQGFFIGQPVSAKRVIEALGGQPYAPDTPASGLSALWDRLLGRNEATPEPPASLPASQPEAARMEELAASQEILEPWSPVGDDVSDPVVEQPEEEPVLAYPPHDMPPPDFADFTTIAATDLAAETQTTPPPIGSTRPDHGEPDTAGEHHDQTRLRKPGLIVSVAPMAPRLPRPPATDPNPAETALAAEPQEAGETGKTPKPGINVPITNDEQPSAADETDVTTSGSDVASDKQAQRDTPARLPKPRPKRPARKKPVRKSRLVKKTRHAKPSKPARRKTARKRPTRKKPPAK